MPARKHKPEEIIGKLREVEIMLGQGGTTAEACRRIAVSEQTYYRWRKEYGGLKTDQARRMKDLEKENARLRRAISDLTLDKLILQEAAKGTSEPCTASTVHRPGSGGAGCIRAACVPRARAASIDTA
jgi:putative transposase